MSEATTETLSAASARAPGLAPALVPGALLVRADGTLAWSDERARELLGCRDGGDLARRWNDLWAGLRAAGLEPAAAPVSAAAAGRPLLFEPRGEPAPGGERLLLVHDAVALEELAAEQRFAGHMRAVAEITPAVAHDLRAPINAMVFNIEILKETIASGKGAEPAGRERQLRYVGVLRDELARLHKSLEIFLAHTSPRGDKTEALDLREPVGELAALLVAPARKQQVQVAPELPDQPVPVTGNRYRLRQALLQVGLAALAGVPRGEVLRVRLEAAGDGRARLWLGGPLEAGDAGQARHRIDAAAALLQEQGGALREAAPAGDLRGYEVELPTAGNG